MMNKLLAAFTLALVAANAHAHFPFLVPDGPNKAKVVFSDSLKPDDKGVPVDKLAATKLYLVGEKTPLTWTLDKKENIYTFEVPGDGSRVVYGNTDYGVFQRGDSKPMWLRYYPKTILGEIPAGEKASAGDQVPVELNPVVADGKLRFKAVAGGKAMAKAEVTVLVPGEEKSKIVTTDDSGMTSAFEKAGQYGAYVRLVEARSGEQAGKKFEEIRHYGTLVVTFGMK
jgi:uncharacterized GH25 family protein